MKNKVLQLIMLLTLSVTTLSLESRLEAKKIIGNKGDETKVSAKTADLGDILEYTYIIDNNEDMSQHQLQPIIPISTNMELIPENINPKEFMVSVDGTTFMEYPVIGEGGNNVPNSVYKAVKWEINEIKPREVLKVSLRAKIKK